MEAQNVLIWMASLVTRHESSAVHKGLARVLSELRYHSA